MPDNQERLIELGRIVQERREASGMTIDTVYERTRIRTEYLNGIEQGDYRDFPETVYIKGFLRTYLKLINAEDLLEDFNQALTYKEYSKASRQTSTESAGAKILGSGSNVPEGFKPASHFWIFLVLGAALLGTISYVWYAFKYGGLDLKNLKLFNFANNTPAITLPENISDDVTPDGVVIEEVTISEEPEVVVEEPKPEPEPIKPSLEIHAINDVWLTVIFASNPTPVYRRTLKRGDVMRWDMNEPVRVVFGRPTAAQVFLNGKDLGIVNSSAKKPETHVYNPDGTHRKIK